MVIALSGSNPYPIEILPYMPLGRGGGTPWPESVSELYRQSDCRLPAKLMPTFADRGRYVVSMTDPYGHIVCF
jgi:hypothetical protein